MKVEQDTAQGTGLPAGLARPARRALLGAGFSSIEQLTRVSEAEVKQLHGTGPNAIRQLRLAMQARGLSFAEQAAPDRQE